MRRIEAMSQGLRFYIGKPCPHGHNGKRYTVAGTCVVCAKAQSKRRGAAGYFRSHYKANAPRILARSLTYYKANRERIFASVKDWVKRNPELRRATANSYKHRRRSIEATGMSGRDLARWTAAQDKVCHWCRKDCSDAFHVDHFYPLSKGGAHREDNLVIACPDCNLRKSAKLPAVFAEEIRAAA